MARPAKGDRRQRFRQTGGDVKPPKPEPKKPATKTTTK